MALTREPRRRASPLFPFSTAEPSERKASFGQKAVQLMPFA